MAFLRKTVKLPLRVFQSSRVPCSCCVKIPSGARVLSWAQVMKQHLWGPFRTTSTLAPPSVLSVQCKHGRPMLALPLPSRREQCHFPLRPEFMSVGDFLTDVQREDPGITSAFILTADGQSVPSSTSLDAVIKEDFQLVINDVTYSVKSTVTVPPVWELKEMKTVVHMLQMALCGSNHQLLRQRHLLERLETLKQELEPLEKARDRLTRRAELRSVQLAWAGLAYLSLQGAFLGYLTWFVYAWDVMEPVTYFITIGTSMGFYAYYILTKQDPMYPEAKRRLFLHSFHRRAVAESFSVFRYNELKEELAQVEHDLFRLRNPIQLQLPVGQIEE